MHQLNVLVLGPNSFISTLKELKLYLKFNFSSNINSLDKDSILKYDVLLFHKESLDNNVLKNNTSLIKILATKSTDKFFFFDAILKLPATINEINSIIESSVAKKVFNKNSSIKIKDYFLDKNEKKLIKDNKFIILTEKEIQLLELFIKNKKAISKYKILSVVWNYSSDADTHTVETHIYRLRKKISDLFKDEKFILSHKNGYFID